MIGSLTRLNSGTFFDDFFPQERVKPKWPAMDATETADKYIVSLELPGLKREDVNITYDNGVLHISGGTSQEQETRDGKYYIQERYHGGFNRSLRLNREIDVNKIVASMDKGVLWVEIPKSASGQTKQIPIQVPTALEG